MYIRNIEDIEEKVGCNKIVADYLTNTCGLSLLGKSDNKYWFSKTLELSYCLKNLPFLISIFKVIY